MSHQPRPPFAGAVLAGGASRRMGRDKALVRGPDGRPLASVGLEALRAAGAATVLAVGGDQDALQALGVVWIADRHPGEGPLGGILTALDAAAEDLVVVMACDMPGVGPEVPGALVDALAAAPSAAAALAVVGDRDQPLTACWRRSAAEPVLAAAYERGERAPRTVLDRLEVVRVAGLPTAALLDVDSPEDLRRYADRHHPGPPTEQEAR